MSMAAQAMETQMQSENINEIAKALAAAQGEIRNPPKNREAKVKGESKSGKEYEYKYRYADISDVLDSVRPVLSKHEIAVAQPTVLDGNVLILQTKLVHSSGQWLSSDYPVCSINGDHQKMGGALTYARRYALCSMLGVAADDDNDGQNAERPTAPAKRTQAEISAQKVAKADTFDDFMRDLQDVHSLVALDRLEKDWGERLTGDSAHRWTMQEHLEKKRHALEEAALLAQERPETFAPNARQRAAKQQPAGPREFAPLPDEPFLE